MDLLPLSSSTSPPLRLHSREWHHLLILNTISTSMLTSTLTLILHRWGSDERRSLCLSLERDARRRDLTQATRSRAAAVANKVCGACMLMSTSSPFSLSLATAPFRLIALATAFILTLVPGHGCEHGIEAGRVRQGAYPLALKALATRACPRGLLRPLSQARTRRDT